MLEVLRFFTGVPTNGYERKPLGYDGGAWDQIYTTPISSWNIIREADGKNLILIAGSNVYNDTNVGLAR